MIIIIYGINCNSLYACLSILTTNLDYYQMLAETTWYANAS